MAIVHSQTLQFSSDHHDPRFECLEMALRLHDECPTLDLSSLKPIIEDGLKNLESRGQHEDGNATGWCSARVLLIFLFGVFSSENSDCHFIHLHLWNA